MLAPAGAAGYTGFDFVPEPMFEHNYESENLACATGLDFYPAVTNQTGWNFVNEGTREKPRWGFVSTEVGASLTIEVDTRAHGTKPLPELPPELRVKFSSQAGLRDSKTSSGPHVPLPASYTSGAGPSTPTAAGAAAAGAGVVGPAGADEAAARAAAGPTGAAAPAAAAAAGADLEAVVAAGADVTAAAAVAAAGADIAVAETGKAAEVVTAAAAAEAPATGGEAGAGAVEKGVTATETGEAEAAGLLKAADGAAATAEKAAMNRILAKHAGCSGDDCQTGDAKSREGLGSSKLKKHERGKGRTLDSSDTSVYSDESDDTEHQDDHASAAAASLFLGPLFTLMSIKRR